MNTTTASGPTEVLPDAQAPGQRVRLPFLTRIALILLMIPMTFSIGPLSMTPAKLLFLFIVPVLVIQLLRGAYGPVRAADYLIFAFAFWMTLAMLANHSPGVAIEYTGSNTITLLGGYLTARATIRDKATFVAMIRFLFLVVLFTLPFAIYEVVTSRAVIPAWMGKLPAITSHNDINHDPRLGLWRAQAMFPHPIHYGIFCSMVFSLVYVGMQERLGWFWRMFSAGIVGLCCFFSVSSGPVLAMMVQFFLIGWAWLFRHTQYAWTIFWTLGISSYVIAELASGRSAVYAIVSRISFSSSTAFSRRILFNYGVDQIGRTPVLGTGFNPWPMPQWMTGSVDNFWLIVAVTFGMPSFIFLVAAFVVPMVVAGRRDFSADRELFLLRRAWIFTLVSLMLVMGTVALWGTVYSLVLFMLGSGIWMLTATTDAPQQQSAAAPQDKPGMLRYTRFGDKKHCRGTG